MVVIMPEAEEIDFHPDMNDCKFDVFRASGNVAVSVSSPQTLRYVGPIFQQESWSPVRRKLAENKDKALKVLRSRLYEMEIAKQHDAEAEARRVVIGTGDRSREDPYLTSLRGVWQTTGSSLPCIVWTAFWRYDLSEIIDGLIAADQAAKLANLNNEEA